MKRFKRKFICIFASLVLFVMLMPVSINADADFRITLSTLHESAVLTGPNVNSFTISDNDIDANFYLGMSNAPMDVNENPFTYSAADNTIGIIFTTTLPSGYRYVVRSNNMTWQVNKVEGVNEYSANVGELSANSDIQIGIEQIKTLTLAADTGYKIGTPVNNTFTFTAESDNSKVADMIIKDSTHSQINSTTNVVEVDGDTELNFMNVASGYSIIVNVGSTLYLANYDDYQQQYFANFKVDESTTATINFVKGYTVSLPAKYDATYNSTFGVVEYSSSIDGNFVPISTGSIMTSTDMTNFETGETFTLYNYTFSDDSDKYLRVNFPANNPRSFTAVEGMGLFDGGIIDINQAKKVIGSGILQYDDWYTISWAYDEAHSLNPLDDIVSNGKIIITKINGKADYKFNGNYAIADDGSGDYGLAMLKPNDEVTVKFVPDPGYQFAGLKINGELVSGVVASDELYTYTFTANNQMHFSSTFIKSDDIVSNQAEGISDVSLVNGANAVGNGNAQLTVNDADVDDDLKIQMQNAAGDESSIKTILDLKLNQIVSKGGLLTEDIINDNTAWVVQKSELDQKVKISIVLDKGVIPQGMDVKVIRNHGGIISEIVAEYDPDTRILSFESDLFSEYAIAATNSSSTPETGTSNLDNLSYLYGLLALFSGVMIYRHFSKKMQN